MYFLSLNNQGLGDNAKKTWVNELFNKNGINFLALQETKMLHMEGFVVSSIWGNSFF